MTSMIQLFLFAASMGGAAEATIPVPIDKIVGCFQVTYEYFEAGQPDYREEGTEYVHVKSAAPEEISLQHYGIFGGQAQVHWGQLWKRNEAGDWSLAVTSPSGAVRYQCSGPFSQTDAMEPIYFRRCEAHGAPKPRRDRNRTDYVTLDRVHWWHISTDGWIDEQHNIKRTEDGKLVAVESGKNHYRRLSGEAAKACDGARQLAEGR